MPNFNSYSADGRTLAVIFTCARCKEQRVELLEAHDKDFGAETYGHLYRINPPSGWVDLLHGPLLCQHCYAKYQKFMTMQEE